MQNILKKVVWACLIIIPFIALYVATGRGLDIFSLGNSGMYFPFISGKNFAFRILVEIAFAGWILLALKDPSYRISFKKSPLLVAYSVFILVLFIADIFGVDVSKSLWSNFERMEGFVAHIHLYLYFVVLTGMLATVADWSRMFKWFVASSVLVNLYAFAQLMGAPGLIYERTFPKMGAWFAARFPIDMSATRLDATLGNSAYYAVYCLMFVFILALLWVQSKNMKKAWWYPLMIVLNILGLFYSGTRGTMIGILVGGLVTLGLIALHEKGKSRKVLVGLVIAVVVAVASVFALKDTAIIKSSPVLSRLTSISPNDITGASRLAMWTISYEAWLERPILGYGQDNFSYVFASKFNPERMGGLEPWYDRSHDVFFDWLIAAGILGLLSYLSLYAVALWLMWKMKNDIPLREKAIVTGMLVGYFIHNVFVFDNLISYILFVLFLAYITVRSSIAHDHIKHRDLHISDENMRLLWAPFVGIALFFTQYYVNYQPLYVNKLLLEAIDANTLLQKNTFVETLKIQEANFKEALSLDTLGSTEAREQFSQTALRMAQVTVPPEVPEAEKKALSEAMSSLLGAVKTDIETSYESYKNDPRMLSIFGMFYNNIGDAVNAERVLTDAHNLAPKKQLISHDLVKAYLLSQKYADAYALARETYDNATAIPASLKWYLITSLYANTYKEAKAHVMEKYPVIAFDQDVMNTALSLGQTAIALEMLNDLKKEKPELAAQIDAYIKQVNAMPKVQVAPVKK